MSHKDKGKKLNCWEFKKCGREKDGANTADLGVCPASTETALHGVHDGTNSGRACWVMEGTLCAASVQGSFFRKIQKMHHLRLFPRHRGPGRPRSEKCQGSVASH